MDDRLTQVQIKPDTKDRLATFKEVSGMTYDEAVNYLIDLVLKPEDGGSVARAGLRVRESLAKDNTPGNQKSHQVIPSGSIKDG